MLKELRPDIYVKGDEWEGKIPPAVTAAVGEGDIRFAPRMQGVSTSEIIQQVLDNHATE
jgi:bifunctional ADP-heptose synthase (sugar kinase/adenylyltransferase)